MSINLLLINSVTRRKSSRKDCHPLQMVVPEQRKLAMENIKVSILGKHLDLEYTMQCKDGSTFLQSLTLRL